MYRKQVEIDGKKFTLGEAVAGEVEECQDALAASQEAGDVKMATAAMRRFVAHCLSRGGFSISATDIPSQFSLTEEAFLFERAMDASRVRERPKGEVLGP
ncbi:MAG: hypothetical protein WCK73_16165 [Deltaproteobacteria bacterium]